MPRDRARSDAPSRHLARYRHALWCAPILAAGIGCTPRTGLKKSTIPVPRTFSQPGQAKLPQRWWQVFQDPELNRLVSAALAGNPDLQATWAKLAQARALARKAGASLLPQIDLQAGAKGTFSRQTRSGSLVLGVAASYEIDLWGRLGATRNAARYEVRASQEDLKAAAISLAAEVATAWFQLSERLSQLDLLARQQALNERVLKLVSFKFGQGQAQAADILQQRQLVESLKGERVQLQTQAQVLRHQLAILVGEPPGALKLRRRTLPRLPPLPRTGVPSDLLRRRPDVRRAHFTVLAADRRVAAALADRYPRLSLSADASLTGGFNPRPFYDWLVNLAANLLAPLFDGGARRAEVARTRAVVAQVLAEYGKAVLVALKEVEDALFTEAHQRRYLDSLTKQLRLSSEVIRQTQQSYLHGALEYLRVLDALIKHQALERTRLAARRDLVLNRVALCRALAGGWQVRRQERAVAQRRAAR